MKIAIMQPYLFPYIGYFQLIHAVDKFVFYDDVQWIKGGWINRNRILIRGEPRYVTLPVASNATLGPINQRKLASEHLQSVRRIMNQLHDAYRNTPHYYSVRELVGRCLSFPTSNVCELVIHSLSEVCSYLDLKTTLLRSSTLRNNDSHGAQRVIEITKVLNGTMYVNAIGGRELYSHQEFHRAGLKLRFLRTDDVMYAQFQSPFVSSLSIIDVLMFNSREETCDLLCKYGLIE